MICEKKVYYKDPQLFLETTQIWHWIHFLELEPQFWQMSQSLFKDLLKVSLRVDPNNIYIAYLTTK